jgi:DNA invertase Pin-like site-specific DNA recombinase
MMSKGKLIGYIRVSSVDQNTERQLVGIKAAGIDLDKVFEEKVSGKSTINRKALADAIDYCREDDELIVYSMDRLARNLPDLLKIVADLNGKKVRVRFVKENLSFTGKDDPTSVLLLSVMGAVAEFERNLIGERQKEGIELAKSRGVYKGRKPIDSEMAVELNKMVEEGMRPSLIQERLNISRSTYYKYKSPA